MEMIATPPRIMSANSTPFASQRRRVHTEAPTAPITSRMDMILQSESTKIETILKSAYSIGHLIDPSYSCSQLLHNYSIIRRTTTVMPKPDNLGQVASLERIDIEKKKRCRIFFQVPVSTRPTPLRIRFNKKMIGSINLLVSKKDKYPWYSNTVDYAIQIKAGKIIEVRAGEKKRTFSFPEIYMCIDCKTDVNGSFVCYFPGDRIEGVLEDDDLREAQRAKTASPQNRASNHYSIDAYIKRIRNDKNAFQEYSLKVEQVKRKKREHMLKLAKNKNILLLNKDATYSYRSLQSSRETNRIKRLMRAEEVTKTKIAIENEIFASRLFFQHRWEIRDEQVCIELAKNATAEARL